MNRSMLIVDDEETIRWALRELFMSDGWEVHCAADGDEAESLIAERPYDFMITDLKMPGVSGVELIRRARAGNSEMGVMVLTGYASLETALEAIRLQAWDYVTKPCKVAYLKERIDEFFDDRSSAAGGEGAGERLSEPDARAFLKGSGMELLSFEALEGDEDSRRALTALREMFAHAGIEAERAGQLVQVCVETVALANGRAGRVRGRAGLLHGHVVVAMNGPGVKEVPAERLREVAESLGVNVRLLERGGAISMVLSEGI
ncbi:MAG: response regulator [Candidatus Brocadiia bacterium]